MKLAPGVAACSPFSRLVSLGCARGGARQIARDGAGPLEAPNAERAGRVAVGSLMTNDRQWSGSGHPSRAARRNICSSARIDSEYMYHSSPHLRMICLVLLPSQVQFEARSMSLVKTLPTRVRRRGAWRPPPFVCPAPTRIATSATRHVALPIFHREVGFEPLCLARANVKDARHSMTLAV